MFLLLEYSSTKCKFCNSVGRQPAHFVRTCRFVFFVLARAYSQYDKPNTVMAYLPMYSICQCDL